MIRLTRKIEIDLPWTSGDSDYVFLGNFFNIIYTQ